MEQYVKYLKFRFYTRRNIVKLALKYRVSHYIFESNILMRKVCLKLLSETFSVKYFSSSSFLLTLGFVVQYDALMMTYFGCLNREILLLNFVSCFWCFLHAVCTVFGIFCYLKFFTNWAWIQTIWIHWLIDFAYKISFYQQIWMKSR